MPTIATPNKTTRRKAMGELIVQLSSALDALPFPSAPKPKLKMIGNGAASKDGNLGSIVQIAAVRAALTGGCLTEEIFCDENGHKNIEPDLDRLNDMLTFPEFPPQKRWLAEMRGTAADVALATAKAQANHVRLFIAKNTAYNAGGSLIDPDNFRIQYSKTKLLTGRGVGDLISDDTEIGALSSDLADRPRRVWIYICIGEVEETSSRPGIGGKPSIFKRAEDAGLVGQKNDNDPTGNTNVRFWAPAWVPIVLGEMQDCYKRHKDNQNVTGFMLDVCDSWSRDSGVWDDP